MKLIDKNFLKEWEEELKKEIKELPTIPCLEIIVAKGYSEASTLYVNNKIKKANELGINTILTEIEWQDIPLHEVKEKLFAKILFANMRADVNGIIVQLPFLEISEEDIASMINEQKDVDGFTNYQKALLFNNSEKALEPCTAKGVIRILKNVHESLEGKFVGILNRSNLIGKPLAHMLLKENATPILGHSKTSKLILFATSDIIVTGCGQRAIFCNKHLSHFTETIVDCSMTKKEGIKGVGDFDIESLEKDERLKDTNVASGFGYTGPATILALMENVIKAYKIQNFYF